MITMAALMPCIYVLGVVFSVKTHRHIYESDAPHQEAPAGQMKKWTAIVILVIATLVFAAMAHVITDKVPTVIQNAQMSPRFVGLVFYTLVPNAAEYMNAIKFALNGNIGLSMEIGNQGAILTALLEMPVLMLLSWLVVTAHGANQFTLVFPMLDIFCVIIAVLLRNSILTERSINYFTGASFLIIFVLISVVYFFDRT
jgi:Ca2+:H+ antiporter